MRLILVTAVAAACLTIACNGGKYSVSYTMYRLKKPFDRTAVAAEAMREARIVGGAQTTIQHFPWQVSMIYQSRHRCGGSVVSERFVLTAAHCTTGALASLMSIRAGSSNRNSGGVVVAVKRIIQHPNYSGHGNDYDISLLSLMKSLDFSESIRAIRLPSAGETISPGSRVWVTGWGDTHESFGISPTFLHFTTLPIVDNHVCASAYARHTPITTNMLCAGYYRIGGRDACQGDSGGPLITNNKQYGIVSFGVGCARPAYPGVYTRVSAFRNWIDTMMAQN